MKYIRLYGYMNNNLGDDLMIEILLNRYPQYRFFCPNQIENRNLIHFSNLYDMNLFYNKWGRLNHIVNILTFYRFRDCFYHFCFNRIAKRCVCAVYIGGSLYIENSDEKLTDRLQREYEKMKDCPLFVIGANFGPYYTESFYQSFYQYFRRCKGVSFRDKKSFLLFKQLSNVQYASDIVFNLDVIDKKLNLNKVIISVIDLSNHTDKIIYKDDYEKIIAEVCIQVVKNGKTPVLVSFCKPEGDEIAIRRIYNLLPDRIKGKVEMLFYNNNVEEILKLYENADFVVATRFHSMILSIRYHIPFYCIDYNIKSKNFLDDLNCKAYCKLENIREISAEYILNNGTKIKDIERIIASAKQQFSQLDKYLKGGQNG